MADVIKMVSRYLAKFNPELTKITLDALYEQMAHNYARAMADLALFEHKTRQVLNLAGIHTALYVPYLDFARELYRLRKKDFTGNSLNLAINVLLEKWRHRGLNPAVLTQIAEDVFEIKTPPDPGHPFHPKTPPI
ncbi:MAG: hypothetical protein ACUVUR_04945 [bacterium]